MTSSKLTQKPQPDVFFKEVKHKEEKEPDNVFFIAAVFLTFLFSYLYFANFYFI